ncbi:hypothetical protein llap_8036 [Limosa lapponica baueri]|uniref:Uncharacterized protein n=1 Tax=Limosa lapponica baueri TaxID=1758121 RepID=A0A2I0U6M9_LIMLA|nr:hypothetical protein llap_8036 [Limosa lapponica baueri]
MRGKGVAERKGRREEKRREEKRREEKRREEKRREEKRRGEKRRRGVKVIWSPSGMLVLHRNPSLSPRFPNLSHGLRSQKALAL